MPDDADALLDWYNDPELVAPFDRFSTDTRDGLREAISKAPDDPRSLAPRYVIQRSSDAPLIGCVGHYQPHPVLEMTDVWYVLGDPTQRGHGIGTEAVGLLVDHLVRSVRLARVGATSDVENVASYRLLEKLGFRREGVLRSALFHHGRWHDVAVYGLLAADWRGPTGGGGPPAPTENRAGAGAAPAARSPPST